MGHLFWEIKSDYLIGPDYTRIARGVLDMDHQICDDLLKLVAGRRKKGFKAKKRFFAQTVKFSVAFTPPTISFLEAIRFAGGTSMGILPLCSTFRRVWSTTF